MHDKRWLSELGYENEPQRDNSFVVHAVLDLLAIAAVFCFAVVIAYLFGGAH
jgi:hypothetical protein